MKKFVARLETAARRNSLAQTLLKYTSPGLPEDALEIIGQIHERVKELNFLRDVRIFTLGFREAHEDFLKKLAADNSGKYVRID